MKHIRCALAFMVSCLVISQSALAAISTCVVPDDQGATFAQCIRYSALDKWLHSPSIHDEAGDLIDDILVEFKPGIYKVANALTIDKLVTKNGRHKLTLAGAGARETVLSGGRSLSFNRVSAGLTKEKNLSDNLVFASLQAAGITEVPKFSAVRFGQVSIPDIELFYRGTRMPLSRWPNKGYAKTGVVTTVAGRAAFLVEGKNLSIYKFERDLRVGGYFMNDWADEKLQVDEIDSAGRVSLANPQPTYGVASDRRVLIENALIDIDLPGEWAINQYSDLIYFLPPKPLQPDDVQVSQVINGLVLNQVLNVEVRDIGFEYFRGVGVKLDQVSRVALRDVTVNNVGSAGISVNGWNTSLERVEVRNSGGAGIALDGGDRKTLQPGGLVIRHSKVMQVGLLHKTYTPAVSISGVGNTLEDSILSGGPHAAIVFHGNDHQIRRNLIENFVTETDDAGAIYTGGDWTERGTVIEQNLIRNIGSKGLHYGAHAIYLDDQASGITVKNNLISNVEGRCVFIGGGSENVVMDNIFANCTTSVSLDARGLWDRPQNGALPNQRYIKKLKEFNVSFPPFSIRYPELANLLGVELSAPKNNSVGRNIFMNSPPPAINSQAKNGICVNESIVIDKKRQPLVQPLVDAASVVTIPALYSILRTKGVMLSPDRTN